MAKYNKINWQTGMEVTPQILINADNFQIEQQNTIRRLQIMPCYGLLPQSIFNADISIEGNILSIKNLVIHAITPQGEVIDINEQGKEPYRLDLNQYSSPQAYIALNYSDFNSMEKDALCLTNNPDGEASAVIIAKISNNIISSNYIPPCIAINSHYGLLESFEEIKRMAESIVMQIKVQDRYKPMFLPFLLLELELKSYSAFKTPADLFLLIKKLASIFKLNIAEVPQNIEMLVNETYCHAEIYNMVRLLLDALCEMEEMTKAPVEAPKIQKIQIAVR